MSFVKLEFTDVAVAFEIYVNNSGTCYFSSVLYLDKKITTLPVKVRE